MNRPRSRRRELWIFVVAGAAVLAVGLMGWLLMRDRGLPPALAPSPTGEETPPPEEPDEEGLLLERATFADLAGWEEDSVEAALPALLASCGAFDLLPGQRELGGVGYAGSAAEWHAVCRAAEEVPAGDPAAARAFFEERFTPWAASDLGEEEGLFTGYYEPTLHGSRRRGGDHQTPLYARPPELITVDLGEFRDDLVGRRVAGRVEDGRLVPMPDRREIEEDGALGGRGLEVVWVDDPVDAFFLHIQGSGLVRMDDGSELRVGYAGQNGHPYRAIGRDLVERGHMDLDSVSMQSIRDWLEAHPEEADEVMALNRSYVFFRRLGGEAPLGAQGVELTPRRSLAVDRSHHPLGVPVWLDASAPRADGGDDEPLRRLLVAQDTGGAIRGPVRGDVFWGPGDEAAEIAGRMKHRGRMWVLLPIGVEPPPEVTGEGVEDEDGDEVGDGDGGDAVGPGEAAGAAGGAP